MFNYLKNWEVTSIYLIIIFSLESTYRSNNCMINSETVALNFVCVSSVNDFHRNAVSQASFM